MVELIFWYAIGAFIVAIMATVDLFHPVLSSNSALPFSEKIIYYVVLFIIALLKAPLLVYPCINKLSGVEFRDSLRDSLFKD